MSAPAPALSKAAERRIVVVRLADAAEAAGLISVAFAVALVAFPTSFPRLVMNSWEHGQLMAVMMLFTLVLDGCLYFRVAHLLSARPGIVAAACLGSMPLLVVGGLSILLQAAVKHTLALDLPNLQGRVGEEILAHTYLGLVAAVFLPFLFIRFLQQFKTKQI